LKELLTEVLTSSLGFPYLSTALHGLTKQIVFPKIAPQLVIA
jgi:hypothetical protein